MWDGYLYCIMRAEDYEDADNGPYVRDSVPCC